MRASLKAATLVAGGSVITALTLTAPAWADGSKEDERAIQLEGNVTTCDGLEAFFEEPVDPEISALFDDTTFKDGDLTEDTHYETDGIHLKIIEPPDGYVVTATIVKGGPGANLYVGDPVEDMVSPNVPSGEPAGISHWFICVDEEPTPTPTQTTTSPEPSPTTTSPEPSPTTTSPEPTPTQTTTSPAPSPTTTSPAPSPTTTSPEPTVEPTTTIPPGEELPDTGTNSAVPMTVAAVLGLAGGGALLLRRRLMS